MRQVKRIPIVLDNMDWELFLTESLKEKPSYDLLKHVNDSVDQLKEYWTELYDMRLGQTMINMGIIPDTLTAWNIEEVDWMIEKKLVEPRDIKFWGVNFTKEMKRLPKTDFKLIKDLDTDHIEAILDGGWVKGAEYKKYFEDELKLR